MPAKERARPRLSAGPRPSCHGVIFDEHRRVLLIRRARPPYARWWALPGGSIQLGETAADALVREVKEETGLLVEPGPLLRHFDAIERDRQGAVVGHYVILYFRAFLVGGTLQPASDAGAGVWAAQAELDQYRLLPPARDVIAAAAD